MVKFLLIAWVTLKLGEMESQGLSRMEQTVLARLMESRIWHLPADSVAL